MSRTVPGYILEYGDTKFSTAIPVVVFVPVRHLKNRMYTQPLPRYPTGRYTLLNLVPQVPVPRYSGTDRNAVLVSST